MQTVLPNTMPIKVFIITLPVVFLATAFLVFNLEELVDALQRFSLNTTEWMRQRMLEHRSKNWKVAATRLQEDRIATELPIKKRPRKTTKWMYLLFALQAILVSIPVYEVRCAVNLYRRRAWAAGAGKKAARHGSLQLTRSDSSILAKKVRAGEKRRQAYKKRELKQSRFALATLNTIRVTWLLVRQCVRLMLLVVWLPLLVVELFILYLATMVLFVWRGGAQTPIDPTLAEQKVSFDWILPLHLLGLNDITHYPAPKPHDRAREFWHILWRSLGDLMNRRAVGRQDQNDEANPRMMVRGSRKTSTFIAPVRRTFTTLFQRRHGSVRAVGRLNGGLNGGLNAGLTGVGHEPRDSSGAGRSSGYRDEDGGGASDGDGANVPDLEAGRETHQLEPVREEGPAT